MTKCSSKFFKYKIKAIFFLYMVVFSCADNNNIRDKDVFRYNEHKNISGLDPAFAKDNADIWAVHQLTVLKWLQMIWVLSGWAASSVHVTVHVLTCLVVFMRVFLHRLTWSFLLTLTKMTTRLLSVSIRRLHNGWFTQ